MGMKPSSHNPTFSNVTPQQVLKLQEFALELTGKRSASALLRLIADDGFVTSAPNIGISMATPFDGKQKRVLVVERPE